MAKNKPLIQPKGVDDAYTVEQAAELTGFCRETLRRHIRRGNLKAFMFKRQLRIERAELPRFMKSAAVYQPASAR